jgi:hypothetical protein
MQHDLKKVGGGGKTDQKPTSAAVPPLCNICGSNHTMDACRQKGFPDTNMDVSVKWSESAVGKAWKDRHDHPRELHEAGRAGERESSKFHRIVGLTLMK